MAGAERQRIFWRHYYLGSQGVIFVLDTADSAENIELAVTVSNFCSLEIEKRDNLGMYFERGYSYYCWQGIV